MNLQDIVRIGIVSAVDAPGKRARVMFKDLDMVSGWLHVLQQPLAVVTVAEQGLHTHTVDSSESSENGAHTHEAETGVWLPSIDDKVLVLYIPIWNADGFILGVI